MTYDWLQKAIFENDPRVDITYDLEQYVIAYDGEIHLEFPEAEFIIWLLPMGVTCFDDREELMQHLKEMQVERKRKKALNVLLNEKE